jgi:branched-subunit amino acid aminotransferase/4-amino-4-deoxychorismate lyase
VPAQGPVPEDRPHLIETMRAEAGEAVRLAAHMARMRASALALGLVFPQREVEAQLRDRARRAASVSRLRVELAPDGHFEVTIADLPALPGDGVPRIVLASERLESRNPLLLHKTNRRAVYERGRARLDAVPGAIDAIFSNERGEVCEGGISNFFLEIDGGLVTPPVACGLLPGIMRADIIRTRNARERVVFPADLAAAQALYITNSVRGILRVVLAKASDG